MKKLGRLPAVYNPLTPKLAKYMAASKTPEVPSVDYTSHINIPFGMMMNDKIGCCTLAGIGHLVMAYSSLNQSDIMLQMMTDEEIETYYKILGNWNPNDSSTDNGCVIVNVLNYWMTQGIRCGTILNKIYGYSYINPKEVDLLRYALYEFGGLYIGIQLPEYCEDHTTWDVTDNMGKILGGHCVTLQGVDDNNNFTSISWGEKMTITPEFLATYCDECYVLHNEHFINPQGLDFNSLKFDLDKLRKNQFM